MTDASTHGFSLLVRMSASYAQEFESGAGACPHNTGYICIGA